ncbi:hypothetical protein BVY11_17505 [Pseudomonas amygdali pv. morsprunorum]|nr:hypothetical protein BVY11_17505 [Pseudomonas amygdali pv. morsprunorum]PPS31148.1 hypothetical protein BVY12_20845 [Pseudomonas amygdali pv. morsprunorum]
MELGQHLLRLVIGNLPKAAGLLPDKFLKTALARVNDFNPFSKLGAKDDLTRALRLAWIDAALKLDESARDACSSPDWISQAGDVKNFSDMLRKRLIALRDVVFDRSIPLSKLSIDQHLQAVIVQAPLTRTMLLSLSTIAEAKSAIRPGSIFNRQRGSVFNQRQQSVDTRRKMYFYLLIKINTSSEF